MVDMTTKGFFAGIFREIVASIDSFIYKLLAGIYNVFFNVATAEVLQASMMKNLFSRVQLILGVIILFKLVISFFSGVVNPDGFGDQQKGFGGVIKRIITVLVMLLMIVPLNIPESSLGKTGMGSWNKNMNTHGILFGTLYEVQKRVLNENLIFKLINGDTLNEEEDYSDEEKVYENRQNAGNQFATDVLRTFLTVNVAYDGADFSDYCKDDDTDCVCPYSAEKKAYDIYFDKNSTIDQLLSEDVVTGYCNNIGRMSKSAKEHGFTKRAYIMAYSKLWSTIVGALFCVLILSLTVDVAVRVFKLVLLQIMSPIAILSYIDPAGEKTFKNWTKAVTETYLSVFIRIAIISFALFIIKNFSLTGFGLQYSKGMIGFVSKILLYFGLIMFAKEAPKYITQTLGIENKDSGGLFSGLGKLVSSAAAGISTTRSAFRASQKADDLNAPGSQYSARNRAKAVASGLLNGIGAAYTTGANYEEAKDHRWRTAMDKVNKANTYRMQNAEEGGTWWGQKKDQLRQDFGGDSEYSRLKREEKGYKDRQERYNKGAEAIKNLDSAVENEVTKKGLQTYMNTGKKGKSIATNLKNIDAALQYGNTTGNYKLGGQSFSSEKEMQKAYEKAVATGSKTGVYEFAGYRYSGADAFNNLRSDYEAAFSRGSTTGVYSVDATTYDAAGFGAARSDAVDHAKNTIYDGTAKYANGNDYIASASIQQDFATVHETMRQMSDDSLIMRLSDEQKQNNPNYKGYSENNDMVTNIKNMKDLMGASSSIMSSKIAGMQPEIGKAQTNMRGTDGGQGGS